MTQGKTKKSGVKDDTSSVAFGAPPRRSPGTLAAADQVVLSMQASSNGHSNGKHFKHRKAPVSLHLGSHHLNAGASRLLVQRSALLARVLLGKVPAPSRDGAAVRVDAPRPHPLARELLKVLRSETRGETSILQDLVAGLPSRLQRARPARFSARSLAARSFHLWNREQLSRPRPVPPPSDMQVPVPSPARPREGLSPWVRIVEKSRPEARSSALTASPTAPPAGPETAARDSNNGSFHGPSRVKLPVAPWRKLVEKAVELKALDTDGTAVLRPGPDAVSEPIIEATPGDAEDAGIVDELSAALESRRRSALPAELPPDLATPETTPISEKAHGLSAELTSAKTTGRQRKPAAEMVPEPAPAPLVSQSTEKLSQALQAGKKSRKSTTTELADRLEAQFQESANQQLLEQSWSRAADELSENLLRSRSSKKGRAALHSAAMELSQALLEARGETSESFHRELSPTARVLAESLLKARHAARHQMGAGSVGQEGAEAERLTGPDQHEEEQVLLLGGDVSDDELNALLSSPLPLPLAPPPVTSAPAPTADKLRPAAPDVGRLTGPAPAAPAAPRTVAPKSASPGALDDALAGTLRSLTAGAGPAAPPTQAPVEAAEPKQWMPSAPTAEPAPPMPEPTSRVPVTVPTGYVPEAQDLAELLKREKDLPEIQLRPPEALEPAIKAKPRRNKWLPPVLHFHPETLDLEKEVFSEVELNLQKAKAQAGQLKVFRYSVKTKEGVVQNGQVESWSKDAAHKKLWADGMTILHLEEVPRHRGKEESLDMSLTLFTRKLAAMYHAGLPIARAIGILYQETSNWKMKSALARVYIDLKRGQPLHKAMQAHPHIFPPTYVGTVEAGQHGTVMGWALNKLADSTEKDMWLKARMKAATIYPAIVFIVGIIVNIIMFVWVLPQFKEIFETLHVELPWNTKLLFFMVELLLNPVAVLSLVLGTLVGVRLLQRFLRTPVGNAWYDSVRLFVPMVGELIRKFIFMQIFRLMGVLTRAAFPISQQFISSAKITDSQIIRRAFLDVYVEIKNGKSVSSAFAKNVDLFGTTVVNMLVIGERSGELARSFEFVAEMYGSEVDSAIESAVTTLEPFLVGVVGIMVGFVVVSLLIPLYSYMSHLNTL